MNQQYAVLRRLPRRGHDDRQPVRWNVTVYDDLKMALAMIDGYEEYILIPVTQLSAGVLRVEAE